MRPDCENLPAGSLEPLSYLSCIGVRRAGVLVHHLGPEQDRINLLVHHLLGIVHHLGLLLLLLQHGFEQILLLLVQLMVHVADLLLLLLNLLDHHNTGSIHHLLRLVGHYELQVVPVLRHHILLLLLGVSGTLAHFENLKSHLHTFGFRFGFL